jgi:hypothetical protein
MDTISETPTSPGRESGVVVEPSDGDLAGRDLAKKDCGDGRAITGTDHDLGSRPTLGDDEGPASPVIPGGPGRARMPPRRAPGGFETEPDRALVRPRPPSRRLGRARTLSTTMRVPRQHRSPQRCLQGRGLASRHAWVRLCPNFSCRKGTEESKGQGLRLHQLLDRRREVLVFDTLCHITSTGGRLSGLLVATKRRE